MGCFWKPEDLFSKIPGVKATAVGFMGGDTDNPSYEQVCSDTTGHAEVVEVEYDPDKISYEQLLDVFWNNHNPTTRNRQGPDIGSQYRSVIFYHDEKQQEAAQMSKSELEESGKYKNPIVTQIVSAQKFNRAEEYHQKYLQKNRGAVC